MIVLDTTVLVYAVGSEHPFRDPCRRLLLAVEAGDVLATTTVEVLQEVTHVRARRRGRADAAAVATDYADLLGPLLGVGQADLLRGLDLFRTVAGLGAFDAVLSAATLTAGADALVSADRAFGSVPGLRHVVPDEDGLTALLRPQA